MGWGRTVARELLEGWQVGGAGQHQRGCPPPEMRRGGQPAPGPHGCQPPHSRRDPVIPHPPPRPPPRLAHWGWHQKATFQRPPATLCQPRILGRTGEWGLLGDAQGRSVGPGLCWGRLWQKPESQHLSTGCGRSKARDRPGAPTPMPPTPIPQGPCLSGLLSPIPTGARGGVTVQPYRMGPGQRLRHGVPEKIRLCQVAKFLLLSTGGVFWEEFRLTV